MEMLDSFGGLDGLREALFQAYRRLQDIRKELTELEAGERDRAQREDMLRFQKNEIESAMLKPGEDEELANEQKLLANSEKIAGLSRAADEALYSSDALGPVRAQEGHEQSPRDRGHRQPPGAGRSSSVKRAAPRSKKRRGRSRPMPIEWSSIPTGLNRSATGWTLSRSSRRNTAAPSRRSSNSAQRRRRSSNAWSEAPRRSSGCKQEIQTIKSGLTAQAQELTKKRGAAARELEKKVEAELAHLGMKKTIFTVKITQEPGDDTLDGHKLGPRGADRVEFLISPNPGEEPKPLAKIASGGELSRIMLALKTILVEGDPIPTLVFDEVDAGIGGAVAEEVGKKLKRVAAKRQVFCITHLPQIASMAASHYGVSKSVKKDRTSTEVRLLGQAGAGRRDRAHARRQDHYRRDHQACPGDDRPGRGIVRSGEPS